MIPNTVNSTKSKSEGTGLRMDQAETFILTP
jgi:hypothetical protein